MTTNKYFIFWIKSRFTSSKISNHRKMVNKRRFAIMFFMDRTPIKVKYNFSLNPTNF